MALPSSGSISLSQVNIELKKTATAKISMGDSAVRALAKKTSGAISMSDLHGKSSEVVFTNTVNHTQANIHTLMGSPTEVTTYIFENTATISAASQGGWALQTGTFPAGSTLKIVNKGYIRGGGGAGGVANNNWTGAAGGTALSLNFPTTIDNTLGCIYGGGGGGGGLEPRLAGWEGGGGAGVPAGSGGGAAATATTGGAGLRDKNTYSGAGGGLGAAGGDSKDGRSGGRGGYSVQRNSHAVTWIAVGDRRGSVV